MSAAAQIVAGPLLVSGHDRPARSIAAGRLTLAPHALLQPRAPLFSPSASMERGRVWKSIDGAPSGSDSLLTMRHIALQSLQLRAAPLLRGVVTADDFASDLFVVCGFDYVYLDERDFRRAIVQGTAQLRGSAGLPVFFDVEREQLVVDCSRFFRDGTPQLTSAAVQGLAALGESAKLVPTLERHARERIEEGDRPAVVDELRGATRFVTRYVLCESGVDLPDVAHRLARDVGARRVARAFLAAAADDSRAVFDAYLDFRRQRNENPR